MLVGLETKMVESDIKFKNNVEALCADGSRSMTEFKVKLISQHDSWIQSYMELLDYNVLNMTTSNLALKFCDLDPKTASLTKDFISREKDSIWQSAGLRWRGTPTSYQETDIGDDKTGFCRDHLDRLKRHKM